jgi:oligosaccharide repeat unit polymerase
MRTDWEKFLIGKYTGSDTGVATTDGLYFLITHFVVITIAVSVYYKRNGRNISFPLKIGLFIALLWCILLLRTGDRNTFFIITLVAIGGVSTYLKRFSALMVVGMILFAFLLYNVVEISRMQNVRSINSIIKIATQTQRYNSITEGSLGNTTITSRVTFHLVPQYHDFFLGKFKIIGFAGIIPFSRKLLVDPDDIFTTSSKILTKGLLGKNSTWGVGSNIISDIYMDFGIFGVAALMFLLGYFGNFVSWKAKTKTDSLKWSVIYLLTLALYCEIPRYSMDFPVRNIVWAFFLFWGFNFIIKLKQRNPILG